MSYRLESLEEYYFTRTEIDKMNKQLEAQEKKMRKLGMDEDEIEKANQPLISFKAKYEDNVKEFEDRFEGLLG